MIVLDTNVLSELMKPQESASLAVWDWFGLLPLSDAFITSITLAEVLSGIELMPDGRRRQVKQAAATSILDLFADRVLSFDAPAARLYAPILSHCRRHGRSVDVLDLQIAAIARSRGMAVATRNLDDLDDCGVELVNPWVR